MENKDKVFTSTHLSQLVQEKKYDEANKYISSYFFKSGANCYVRNGLTNRFDIYKLVDAKTLIPKDCKTCFPNTKTTEYNARDYLETTKFYATEHLPTINFQKPTSFTAVNEAGVNVTHLNMAKPGVSFGGVEPDREKLKPKLQMVYDHIKTVWANNDEEHYQYILKFLACSIMGRKVRKVLYLQCDKERSGRGSILGFIKNIIGERMYTTSAVEEVTKYNKQFEGRSLIVLDELPEDGSNFKTIGDAMKSLVTENHFGCRDMYSAPYQQKNTFSFVITSQHFSVNLTQTNNSRYFCPTINTVYCGNTEYFKKLHKVLASREIQKLFLEDMETFFKTKCKKWNEDDMPNSAVKTEKLIESLPRFVKWFKKEYALKKQTLNMSTSDFMDEYQTETNDTSLSAQKIGRHLKDVGIESKVLKLKNGTTKRWYKMKGEDIYKAFLEKQWIDGNLDNVEVKVETDKNIPHDLDVGVDSELEKLKEQIKQLQNIVAGQAEMLLKRKPKKPEPESDSESEEESDEEEEEETNVIKVLTKTTTKTQKCDNFFDALDFDVVCTKKKKKEKSIQMST